MRPAFPMRTHTTSTHSLHDTRPRLSDLMQFYTASANAQLPVGRIRYSRKNRRSKYVSRDSAMGAPTTMRPMQQVLRPRPIQPMPPLPSRAIHRRREHAPDPKPPIPPSIPTDHSHCPHCPAILSPPALDAHISVRPSSFHPTCNLTDIK